MTVPAHQDSAIPPALMLTNPTPPPPIPLSTSWKRNKKRLKATMKVNILRPEIYSRNEPLGEFEHNNCSASCSAQTHRHCDRS